MPSLIEVRFNLVATVLPGAQSTSLTDAPNLPPGTLEQIQNPITGEIEPVWKESTHATLELTPDPRDGSYDIFCEFRGIIAAGTRGAASTETWGKEYMNIDIVKMRFPRSVTISNRDRVFNVRPRAGYPAASIWNDPEGQPTLWDVRGITPVLDPFGRKTDNYALLERVQNP
jgi:hypothetical protein